MIQIKSLSPGDKDTTPLQVIAAVMETLLDLEGQLNGENNIYYASQGQAPEGLKEGDLLIQRIGTAVNISIKNSGRGYTPLSIPQIETVAASVTALAARVSTLEAKTKNGSASLDFPNTNAGSSSDLTIAVAGATITSTVQLGIPNVSMSANSSFTAWVSSANIVTVRFNNYSIAAINPTAGTFNVSVTNF